MLEVRCGEASPLQGAETSLAEKTKRRRRAGRRKRGEKNLTSSAGSPLPKGDESRKKYITRKCLEGI